MDVVVARLILLVELVETKLNVFHGFAVVIESCMDAPVSVIEQGVL